MTALPLTRRLLVAALVALMTALGSSRAGAHELANQIVVQAFLKVSEDRSELIARVPLILLQGVGLPTRGPGFIDFEAVSGEFDRAAVALADQLRLTVDGETIRPEEFGYRVSLPTERTFETFEAARRHVLGPDLPVSSDVMWNQGFFDVYFEYPPFPDDAEPTVDVALGAGYGELLQLVLRYLPRDGTAIAFRVHGDHGPLALDPGFWSAAATFTRSGIEHILSGIDHLLFLLCLILPFRLADVRSLIAIVTAFTVAHSITLIATALGQAPAGPWFPPLIEVLIAASIVYMAVENVWVAWTSGLISRLLRFRWLITGLFGLIHGFGFAFVLRDELQFAGDHLIASLLAFNVGVELGQIGVLLVALPVLELLRRTDAARRMVLILGSFIIGHTAWHWMSERMDALALVELPEIGWGTVRPLAALGLILAGIVLLVLMRRSARAEAAPGDD